MLSISRNQHASDFVSVTEQPGLATTREGFSMLQTRYSLAADLSAGKRVLEVACGAGMGLGLLAKSASHLVASDFSEPLLRHARRQYGLRLAFVRLDAHSLPFADASFDLVLCFEAIYYLRDPGQFVRECRRILRPKGVLLICGANPACPGFNRSPLSYRYFPAEELRRLLVHSRFSATIQGAFPFSADTIRCRIIGAIRSAAVRFHLVPRSMKGKVFLKRVFFGKLVHLQGEIQADLNPLGRLHPIVSAGDSAKYRVLYAIARR